MYVLKKIKNKSIHRTCDIAKQKLYSYGEAHTLMRENF